MNFATGMCIFLSIAFNSCAAAAFREGSPPPTVATLSPFNQSRTLRATDGQTSNMTVAFVPLISIIANLLPRFFNRYAASPTTVKHARSLSLQEKQQLVHESRVPHNKAIKWSDKTSSLKYYRTKRATSHKMASPSD